MRISDDNILVALTAALATVVSEEQSRVLAVRTLEALAVQKDVRSSPALLTLNGRVLVDLINHPETSLQQSADRLGLTSANVGHAMTRVVEAEWGVRTRVGRYNTYQFDPEVVLSHRDSIAFLKALVSLAGDAQTK